MTDKIVLWDIDGTLIESSRQSTIPLHIQVVRELGSKLISIPFEAAGMTDSEIIDRLIRLNGTNPNPTVIKTALDNLERLSKEADYSTKFSVLPGVVEILESLILSSWKNGVLTGNTLGRASSKLSKSNLAKFFDAKYIFTCLPGESRQEIADRANAYLLRSGINNVIIIGDTPADIEVAHNVGFRVIAVASGKFSCEELDRFNPNLLLKSLEDAIYKVKDFINS